MERLALTTTGKGEPAVFVHGFASNRFVWRQLCRGLRDHFTCYAIDLPGCGESPAPRHFDYSLQHLADVLAEFVITKNLRNVTLVGASLGAAVILLAVLRHRRALSTRVKGLCLIGAVAFPQDFPPWVVALRSRFLGPLAVNLPSLLTLFAPAAVSALLAISPRARSSAYLQSRSARVALIETARLLNAEDLSGYVAGLKGIDVPALLIWGREDRVVPLPLGKRLSRELKGSRLVVLDRCGHRPHIECPAKVIAAIRAFAREIDAAHRPFT